MTNREVFMKVFPVVFPNKQYPNLLEWTDNKGKQEILCDVFDATFGDAEYQGPLDSDYVCDLIDKLPSRK